MKIAFFSGPIEYSVCLANAISAYCTVNFFYSVRYAKQRDESILNLLDSKIEKFPINTYRIRDIRNLCSYYKIMKTLHKYDIIHLQGGDFWFGLWRYLYKSTPIVFTAHDPYQHPGINFFNNLYQDIAQRISISQSSKFIVHGEKLKSHLSKRYKLQREDIEVIPHGEFSFYKNVTTNAAPIIRNGPFKRLLFFGSVRRNKGLEYLIKAEPLISKHFSDYKICIAGKFSSDFEFYNQLIINREKFEIIDEFIPVSQVAHLFKNSDIIVLPYIDATQSGILPLAFGFEKPVVATDTGSINEVLLNGNNGLIVPPCDEKSLAKAILELLLDEKKCEELGRNARVFAESKLNWKGIAEQTFSLYKEVLTNRQRSSPE